MLNSESAVLPEHKHLPYFDLMAVADAGKKLRVGTLKKKFDHPPTVIKIYRL
jgi:hypothetical protein